MEILISSLFPFSSGAYIAEARVGSAEFAGDFGPQPVADRTLAAGQGADEEADAFVAEFHVGAHVVAGVAAAQLDRLEAGGFHVLEDEVLVIVLAVDFQLDLDQVAALQLSPGSAARSASYFSTF